MWIRIDQRTQRDQEIRLNNQEVRLFTMVQFGVVVGVVQAHLCHALTVLVNYVFLDQPIQWIKK